MERGVREMEVGKEGISRNRKRLDFVVSAWCSMQLVFIELYIWNLYGFINKCHPNRFDEKIAYVEVPYVQKINQRPESFYFLS